MREKTSAVWLGSRRNSVVKYMQHLGMEWNPPTFNILGILFTSNLENCENITYSETQMSEVKKSNENMDEEAYFTTWQGYNLKTTRSLKDYTPMDYITKPTT